MDRGAWRATDHGITKHRTQLIMTTTFTVTLGRKRATGRFSR